MTDLKKVSKKDEVEPVVQPLPSGVTKTAEVFEDYKLEIIRDYDGKIDPFYLSQKDPSYEYRFLRDDPKNMSMKRSNLLFQKGGWQVCSKEHLLRIGVKEEELAPDGLLRRGDTILSFMPKKLFEEKKAYKEKEAEEAMSAVDRLVAEGREGEGIKTKHKLGM